MFRFVSATSYVTQATFPTQEGPPRKEKVGGTQGAPHLPYLSDVSSAMVHTGVTKERTQVLFRSWKGMRYHEEIGMGSIKVSEIACR
jgi:hypothetical protein